MPSASGNSTFVYDPTDPVPTVGGNNLLMRCGPLDQSALESRADVLVFTSAPFEEEFAITGHMYANLFVSSNCTDTDFTAKARCVGAVAPSDMRADYRRVSQRHVAAHPGRHHAHALVRSRHLRPVGDACRQVG